MSAHESVRAPHTSVIGQAGRLASHHSMKLVTEISPLSDGLIQRSLGAGYDEC